MIVDASVVIDAVADAGPRGTAARSALAAVPAAEPLIAPGHFAFEVMSGLRAAAHRPGHPLRPADVPSALAAAESLEVVIEGTPWSDVHRAWALQGSMRYADGLYVAAAERHATALLTADGRVGRSGASIRCELVTVVPGRV
ncbi:type II toxin-antitoxin system VapC family toxin [Geodermatophilus sp. YIM 151500]|uniref:type II toxin-antitoxin system VapC family toxin n=1 Tax=Geodermatophilus sp. YIM 151500 TaxID=2984531 RepID=UPI0021E468D3|nr:type II toxin-antitoxin system VapC family toxin [Geodermatophilus sp. YIM 151500]MCV2489729.1 type II toxin-antitoxin system VapC family toxin [Geodermatophilus sp. YIM 151500]